MNKFENVDVLASLQQIMQQNTAAFQNDFDIDKKILTQAAKSKNAEDKVYLWFSRPNGTHCLRERDVFLRGTREHNTFRFYHEQTKERVLAYAVVLSGMESGKVKGSIYELDYATKAELAIQTALRTDNNRLIYEKGSRELPKEYRFEATPDREYGKFVRYEAVPHDPDALRNLLRDESRKRERLKPGNFREHIGGSPTKRCLPKHSAFRRRSNPCKRPTALTERILSQKYHRGLSVSHPARSMSGYLRCFRIRRCIFPRSRTDTAFSLLSARTSGAICRCASSVPLSGRSSKRGSQKRPLHLKRQRQRRKIMIWRYEHGQCFVHH